MAAKTIRWAGMRLTVEGAAEFQQKLKDVNNQLKISQGELNKVTNAFGKNEQNATTLAAQHRHLEESLRLNSEKQKALNMTLDDAVNRYGENSSEVLGLRASLAEAEAEQVRLERALRETERAIQGQSWTELGQKMQAAGERMQAVGDKMQSAGRGLSIGVTAPLMGIGVLALRTGADFESAMGVIRTNTDMTAEEMDELSATFRDLARDGELPAFTARQIAHAFSNVAAKGQDVAYGTDLMRYSMVLAAAANKDLASTTQFLADYLEKTGKDVSDLERYINIFAATSRMTRMPLSTLQDYLFRTNVTLRATNISSAEASAMFGRLYQAGIKGAQAYSGLTHAMRSLLTPTEAQLKALGRLNVARYDENDQLRDGVPFLLDVARALDELEGTQLSYYNQLLGSTEMGAAFLGGMIDIKGVLPDTIADLYEAAAAVEGTGVAFEMAATQQDGLTGSSQQVRASLEEIKLQITDQLMPHAQRLIETVSVWVDRFANLDEGTQRNIIRIAAFAAAIGPVLTIGGKLVSTTGKITTAFGKMSAAVGAAGGLKAYLATKFPVLTAGMTTAKGATVANTTATVAATKSTAAYTTALTVKTGKLALASVKMRAFATGMTAKAATMGVLTKGLAAVTAGFIKLTAAMLANPIGLIVAGVAALAGGIAYLIIRANRVSEAYQEMAEETARLVDRQNELAEAAADAAAQFEQGLTNIQNQAEHYRGLADSIAYLSSKQELSAGEMELLQRHIEELNNSVPGLNMAFDEQTGALNMTVDAMNAYLAAAEQRAKMDAMLEEELRLRQEAINLEYELMHVAAQREALEEQLNDGSNRRRADRRALEQAIEDLIAAEENYIAVIEANAEMQAALAEGIEIHADVLRELEKAQQEAAEAVAELTAEMESQARKAEELERAQTQALEKMNRSFENYKRIASNAFSTISENAAISVQDLTANLQENARAVEDWSKNIAILAERGVDQGLIEQLRQAGPEAAATIRELVQASDDELDALNTAFEDSTRVAVESMMREFDPVGVTESAEELINHVADAILNNTSMEDALVDQVNNAFGAMSSTVDSAGFDWAGTKAVLGFTSGITDMQTDVIRVSEETGEILLNSLNSTLESNSPSRATERIGGYAGDGLIKGVKDTQFQVVDTAKTLARAFVNGIADKINHSPDVDNATRRQVEDIRRTAESTVMAMHFEGIGQEIANGVARGIQNGGGIVSNAAQNMINNALMSMRAAAAIHSPSRKTRIIGQQLMDGITGGLASKMGELAAYCKHITDKIIDSLQIDTTQLVDSAYDVLRSMQTAIPVLESSIHYTTSPQATSAYNQSPQIIVDMTRGSYYVREDADVDKIAAAVEKKLTRKVGNLSRVGGAIYQL